MTSNNIFEDVLTSYMTLSGRTRENEINTFVQNCLLSEPFTLEGRRCIARVNKVTDGDSMRVSIPVDGSVWEFSTRLYGIDAPESRARDVARRNLGKQAKAFVTNLLIPGGESQMVALELIKFDRFGRLLSNLYLQDGRNIADILLEKGLAIVKKN